MAGIQSQTRFLGIDLSYARAALATAWRLMLQWPVLAWLWPKPPIRLWLPTNVAVLSHGADTPQTENLKQARLARFEAVQIPESLLLRATLVLPKLQPHELLAALSLQIAGISPFTPTELVWAYEIESRHKTPGETLSVHLVLTSRTLVARHIAQTHPAVDISRTEVWVSRAIGQEHLVLPGFAESIRAHHRVVWLWVNGLLAAIAILLALAIALTPSIQLYLRAQQAQLAMSSLQQKAAPATKLRESLVHTTDQLSNLDELLGKTLPPVQVLKIITDALPDDTSLLSLRIQGLKVSISGQTSNAAALMKQLGATPGLRDVTAPTPAVKPLGATREQFTIEFTLDSTQPLVIK